MSQFQATVQMNPLGPHFFVTGGDADEFPIAWKDAITDVMNLALTEEGLEHRRIHGHTDIVEVTWDEDEFEIGDIELSREWYSEDAVLHEWDAP